MNKFKEKNNYRKYDKNEVHCHRCMWCTLFNYKTRRYYCRIFGYKNKFVVAGHATCDLAMTISEYCKNRDN
jgi:hypothetical protein